jgi:hypothetical protein
LSDLQEGRVYRLGGDRASVGRDVPAEHIVNTISFQDRLISRHHLTISRDRVLEDLRSTNGTTVNAQVLPYGYSTKLNDGDIVVAAGIRVFRFSASKPEQAPIRPANAWGILVDGPTREPRYLTDSSYSITFSATVLTLDAGDNASAPLRVRFSTAGVEVFDRDDEWSVILYAVSKGEPGPLILRSGFWSSDVRGLAMQFMQLSPNGEKVVQRGPAFQIVPLQETTARAP